MLAVKKNVFGTDVLDHFLIKKGYINLCGSVGPAHWAHMEVSVLCGLSCLILYGKVGQGIWVCIVHASNRHYLLYKSLNTVYTS